METHRLEPAGGGVEPLAARVGIKLPVALGPRIYNKSLESIDIYFKAEMLISLGLDNRWTYCHLHEILASV